MPYDGTHRQLTERGQIYQNALAALRKTGWCQGHGRIGDNQCIANAIGSTGMGRGREVVRESVSTIGQLLPDDWMPNSEDHAFRLVVWNDDESRTFADIEELLERAIALELVEA